MFLKMRKILNSPIRIGAAAALVFAGGVVSAGSLDVNGAAAAAGNYGLEVLLAPDASSGAYVQKTLSADELAVKFSWRSSSVAPTAGAVGFYLMILSKVSLNLDAAGTAGFLKGAVLPNGFAFWPGCRDNLGNLHWGDRLTLSAAMANSGAFRVFTFSSQKSTGAGNGRCCLDIEGVGQTCTANFENAGGTFSGLSLGLICPGLPSNLVGSFHVDEVLVTGSPIGAALSYPGESDHLQDKEPVGREFMDDVGSLYNLQEIVPPAGKRYGVGAAIESEDQLELEAEPMGAACGFGPDALIADMVGLYAPATSNFYLRAVNAAGLADRSFIFGPAAGWVPLAGDWNGDHIDTPGLFDPSRSQFLFRNSNSSGIADISIRYGAAGAGWKPIVGDWDGDGADTIGLFDAVRGMFLLRNSNSPGVADLSFRYGPAGANWTPLVGDWDGDGVDSIGLFDPARSRFLLRNSNSSGVADLDFRYGPAGAGWTAFSGDFRGVGMAGVGLYDGSRSLFLLRYTPSSGNANLNFRFGSQGAGWLPLTGRWGL